jgi:Ca2+-binding RTX toxin-like protein
MASSERGAPLTILDVEAYRSAAVVAADASVHKSSWPTVYVFNNVTSRIYAFYRPESDRTQIVTPQIVANGDLSDVNLMHSSGTTVAFSTADLAVVTTSSQTLYDQTMISNGDVRRSLLDSQYYAYDYVSYAGYRYANIYGGFSSWDQNWAINNGLRFAGVNIFSTWTSLQAGGVDIHKDDWSAFSALSINLEAVSFTTNGHVTFTAIRSNGFSFEKTFNITTDGNFHTIDLASAGFNDITDLQLSSSSSNEAVFFDALTVGSPTNPGTISISDESITEGNSGTRTLGFVVTRTGGTSAFSVSFSTANGTAISGSDYFSNAGTLQFLDGENTKTISVTLNGDTAIEPNETFYVNLSGANNGAIISDSQGSGTILNDDSDNHPPVVAAHNFNINSSQVIAATSFFSASDPDGDAITQYYFYDDNNLESSGYFTLNGIAQGRPFYTNDPSAISYVGGSITGSESLGVQVQDSRGAWSFAAILTATTQAPIYTLTEEKDVFTLPSAGTCLALGSDDTIYGTNAADWLYGGDGNDWLFGNGANDIVQGEGGNDVLQGGDGNDTMYAGAGFDYLYGDNGNDVLIGGPEVGVLQGGAGNDYMYLYYAGGLEYGGNGDDVLVGNLVTDVLIGEDGADVFYGYGGNDYFYCGAGNDTMFGGDGVDVLIGEDGNDYFDGGPGVNYYFGGNGSGPGTGLGANTFNVNFGEIDVIQDWTRGLDKIQLSGTGFRSFADVQSHSYQNGSYFIVQPNSSTAVWINGATAASLSASDLWILS